MQVKLRSVTDLHGDMGDEKPSSSEGPTATAPPSTHGKPAGAAPECPAQGSRSAHSHSHLYEAVDQILLCMRKAGAGADEGRPSGCQEETAGGLSSSQPRQEPSEGDNKKQTPTFRFPQGNWSTREQYYAQVPFQGNPYAGKGGPSAPFIDPLAMPPVSYF